MRPHTLDPHMHACTQRKGTTHVESPQNPTGQTTTQLMPLQEDGRGGSTQELSAHTAAQFLTLIASSVEGAYDSEWHLLTDSTDLLCTRAIESPCTSLARFAAAFTRIMFLSLLDKRSRKREEEKGIACFVLVWAAYAHCLTSRFWV